ncbi:hypothetical protein [Bacillus sp. ISL-34]
MDRTEQGRTHRRNRKRDRQGKIHSVIHKMMTSYVQKSSEKLDLE